MEITVLRAIEIAVVGCERCRLQAEVSSRRAVVPFTGGYLRKTPTPMRAVKGVRQITAGVTKRRHINPGRFRVTARILIDRMTSQLRQQFVGVQRRALVEPKN